jgi:hypothetical protein
MTDFKMPRRLQLGDHMASTIITPIFNWMEWKRSGSVDDGCRMVMGYRLPEWQRPFVWVHSQKVRLIESLWLGVSIGTYTFNRDDYDSPYDNLLIDGQQRMKSVEDYLSDQFPVFGYHWSDLSRPEQHRFEMSSHFHCYITKSTDDAYLRGYYDMMNFGGTAHDEKQRAT